MGLEAVQGTRKPTLLEKVQLWSAFVHVHTQPHKHTHTQLLAPEIRHEENALLQCIHHITINNFFTEQPTIVECCDIPKWYDPKLGHHWRLWCMYEHSCVQPLPVSITQHHSPCSQLSDKPISEPTEWSVDHHVLQRTVIIILLIVLAYKVNW